MPAPGCTTLAMTMPISRENALNTRKIQHRLDADPARLFHVIHSSDAGDDGAENNRPDQHLNQLDESIA